MRRVKVAIVAGAVIMSGLAVVPLASAGSSLCASNKACIYDQADYYSLLSARAGGLGAVNVVSQINDKMSSWENKTTYNARWHSDANSNGTCRTMGSKKESSYVGSSDNDRLTSWATNGKC